jgi:nucleoside-diphosphate-sugar epimerase
VIHTAFIHDFSKFKENCEIDKRAIEVLGSALTGSDRPLIVTSGIGLISPGRLATEDTPASSLGKFPRVSEETAASVAASGVRVSAVRLPPTVHGDGDHGFIPILIGIARQKGVSAYIGDGLNRWPAVHRLDAAHLYKLVIEKMANGDTHAEGRYHGVAEEGIPFRDIAAVIGKRLKLPAVSKSPEEAANHFGWFAMFAGLDCPASSRLTQERLGWRPKQPGLIPDLDREQYFKI